MGTALIVDDDADFTRMMVAMVARFGFEATVAPSLRAARRKLAVSAPDVVLLDMYLPDGEGLSLLEDKDLVSSAEVVLMTGSASLENSIGALRRGAADYLVKPVGMPELKRALSRLARPQPPVEVLANLHADLERSGRFGPMVGRSGRMRLVYEQIARVCATPVPVFITGESGTGKKLAARAVHELGTRAAGPFVDVLCATVSPLALEAELFGAGGRPGAFERAGGGTLFLDAVDDMPQPVQARLLGALRSGRFARVDGGVARESDARIVAASRSAGPGSGADGLRSDLFYRLCVFPIEMPPLRERLEDLPRLTAHLLREIGKADTVSRIATPAALQRLAQHDWPGNVRELRNALQQACVMSPGRVIQHAWLPGDVSSPARPLRLQRRADGVANSTLAEVQRTAILAMLARCDGHRERTAAALGISVKTLYSRLKQYAV